MADIPVGAGVLIHVAPLDDKNFDVVGLNADSIQFAVENVDSETVSFNINFSVSKSYLTKEDIILVREDTKDLAHFPFDSDDPEKVTIAVHALEVKLSQGKESDPVKFVVTGLLPFSKVGGAPVKVGGAPGKVGGAGL